MALNAYLSFDGTCREAMTFYHRVFGGDLTVMGGGEAPGGEAPPGWEDRVMHARLTIGHDVLMASDTEPGVHPEVQGFCMSWNTSSEEETDRVWTALSEGAREIQLPLAPTFFAIKYGMLTDRFGTPWMVNFERPH